MLNRFDRRASLRSNYIPQEYIPNFDMLAKALQVQQQNYDQTIEASQRLPQHLQADANTVMEYKKDNEQRMQAVVESYKNQGIQAGNIARKQLLNQLKQDFSPTGKAYNIEQNYTRFQTYKEQLDDLKAKGKITNDTYNAAIQKSMRDFGSSYDNNVYNEFNGYQTAEDIDLTMMADEFLTGWQPDKIAGRPVKVLNGEFYYAGTTTKVSAEEIEQAALEYLQSQPQAQAYLQQLDTLFENNDPNGVPNSIRALNDALRANARKHSKLQQDGKYFKNWALADARKRKFDSRFDGSAFGPQYNSGVINDSLLKQRQINIDSLGQKSDYALQQLKAAEQAKQELELRKFAGGKPATQKELDKAQARIDKAQSTYDLARKEDPDVKSGGLLKYITSPEAQTRYPGIKQAITSLQRKNDESRQAFAERAVQAYNKALDNASQYVIRANSFGSGKLGADARKYGTEQILGAEGIGELIGMTVQLKGPDGTLREGVSFDKLMEEAKYEGDESKGISPYEQWKKNAQVLGVVEDGSGQVIEGSYHITFSDAEGNPYEAFVNTENTASHNWRRSIQQARSGYRDFNVNLTQPVPMAVGVNEDGSTEMALVQFKYGFDSEGNRTRTIINPETGNEVKGRPEDLERLHLELMPKQFEQIQRD